jgi:hypothetical protein
MIRPWGKRLASDDCFVFLETIINLKGEKEVHRMESGESPNLAKGAFCRFF